VPIILIQVIQQQRSIYSGDQAANELVNQNQINLTKDVESSQRSIAGQNLANDLGIEIYKEFSCKNGEINEVIESILLTAVEPKRGLSKEKVKLALEIDNSSDFFGMFKANGNDGHSISMTAVTLIATAGIAIASLAFYLK
jgi:protein-disulfide isomerase